MTDTIIVLGAISIIPLAFFILWWKRRQKRVVYALPEEDATEEEVQEWFRSLPIMSSFYRGKRPGWRNLDLIDAMYKIQTRVVGPLNPGETFKCKALAIVGFFFLTPFGFGLGMVVYYLSTLTSSLAVMPWYIVAPAISFAVGGGGWIAGKYVQAVTKYNKVYIPFLVFQYNNTDHPDTPTDEIVGCCPRMAFFAEREHQFFYGLIEGGGLLTATHIRLKSQPTEGIQTTTTENMLNNPAREIYALPPHLEFSTDTQGRMVQAQIKASERAAEARPKSSKEKASWKNAKTGAFAILAIGAAIAVFMMLSGTSPADLKDIAEETAEGMDAKPQAVDPYMPRLE